MRAIIADPATSKASGAIPWLDFVGAIRLPAGENRSTTLVKQGAHMLTCAVAFIALDIVSVLLV